MEERNENNTVGKIFITIVICVFVAMGVYFVTDTKKIVDNSNRELLCPYRFRTEVAMKDAMFVSFHGELFYNYDSVPFDQVQLARIIVDNFLRQQMLYYTIEDIADMRTSDIDKMVNNLLEENDIPCKWYCTSMSSYDHEMHERIEQRIRVKRGISDKEASRLVSSDSLRYGRCLKRNDDMDRLARHTASFPGFFPWFLVFGGGR